MVYFVHIHEDFPTMIVCDESSLPCGNQALNLVHSMDVMGSIQVSSGRKCVLANFKSSVDV